MFKLGFYPGVACKLLAMKRNENPIGHKPHGTIDW